MWFWRSIHGAENTVELDNGIYILQFHSSSDGEHSNSSEVIGDQGTTEGKAPQCFIQTA